MKLVYRTATRYDIPQLIAIEQSVAGNKNYSPMLEEAEWQEALDKGEVLLLIKDGEIIGNASYEKHGDNTFYISGIVIVPKYQGLGIGRQVLAKLMDYMKDAERIELVTHPDNTAALKLYTQAGFIIESRHENYFGDNEPRLVLSFSNSK